MDRCAALYFAQQFMLSHCLTVSLLKETLNECGESGFFSVWHHDTLLEPLIPFVFSLLFLCFLVAGSLWALLVFLPCLSSLSLTLTFSPSFLSCFFPLLISNAVQLLSCSPLRKNFRTNHRPPSAGSHLFHVCRRGTVFCTVQTLFFHHRDSCCTITLGSSTMAPGSAQWWVLDRNFYLVLWRSLQAALPAEAGQEEEGGLPRECSSSAFKKRKDSCPVLFLSLQGGGMNIHSSCSQTVTIQGKYDSLVGRERQSCDSQCGKARS